MAAGFRRFERPTAAAILIAAVLLAAWVTLRPAPLKPPPVKVQAQRPKPRPPLQMEFVELLPEPSMTPPPVPAALPPISPPAPGPVALAQAPPIVVPPLPAIAMPEPEPVVPLKPSVPEPAPQPIRVEPLRPQVRETIAPLKPEEPKPRVVAKSEPLIPLRPTPPQVDERKPPAVEPPPPPRPKPAEVKPLVPESPPKVASPPAPKPEPPKQIAKASPRPVPRDEPKPMVQPAVVMTSEAVGEGRALLRMFERGAGPGIEIRWPADARQRARLYQAFVQCLGMRVGLVDNGGRLYLGEGKRGVPSELNADRYSGFVRQPEGDIPDREQDEVARVRAYHNNVAYTSAARLFPRRVDAFLIGGLRQAVGEHYLRTKSIRAAYRLDGDRVIVENIVADGRTISGAIDLSDASAGCSG